MAAHADSKALSLHDPPDRRAALWFVFLSWAGILCVFRGALWGGAILAPMDIPPALYSKFKWLDPSLGGVPRNHWLVDMFDNDLPRMYLAHQAVQAGEFPWWDPYSHGGRPLAAEAALGLPDPIRMTLFRFLPFVPAYNWTRILESFLTGLGMFVLLRFLACSSFAAALGALSFQFCGLQAMFFAPENVSGSLMYYPFLWFVLGKYARSRPPVAVAWGGVLCAGSMAAGSLQSDACLGLFLFCFAAGYGGFHRERRAKLLLATGASLALGCLLAAPILVPQIELFLASTRDLHAHRLGAYLFTGLFSVMGVFPWLTGSFRTLDLGKALDQQGAAYVVFLGAPVMILAVTGLVCAKSSGRLRRPEVLTSILLTLVYLFGVCSTPLLNLLYLRSAALAVAGLTVMFAIGLQTLLENASPQPAGIVRRIVGVLTVAVVCAHLFAIFVYPRIKERVLQVVLARDKGNPLLPAFPELRRFQVANLPAEITFRNPEPLLAFCGALALLALASAGPRARPMAATGVFVFNLAPLILFFIRFMPYSPVAQWRALLQGGPEQQAVLKALGRDLRLAESPPGRFDYVFPGVTALCYKAHTLVGYSSFPLLSPGQTMPERSCNFLYTSTPGKEQGELSVSHEGPVRFVWSEKRERDVTIVGETLNTIRLRIAPGPTGTLVRTDTYYPGWQVESPPGIAPTRNRDGFLAFAIPQERTDLILRYQPSRFRASQAACGLGVAAVLGMLVLAGTAKTVEGGNPPPGC